MGMRKSHRHRRSRTSVLFKPLSQGGSQEEKEQQTWEELGQRI